MQVEREAREIFFTFCFFYLTFPSFFEIMLLEKKKGETRMLATPNLITNIQSYERGLMEEKEMVVFFQYLLDSGVINYLQGHYGREAECLIEDGLCK